MFRSFYGRMIDKHDVQQVFSTVSVWRHLHLLRQQRGIFIEVGLSIDKRSTEKKTNDVQGRYLSQTNVQVNQNKAFTSKYSQRRTVEQTMNQSIDKKQGIINESYKLDLRISLHT